MILKNHVHDKVLKIKEAPDGLDFYFKTRDHTRKLIHFLQSNLPCKIKESKQLISQNLQCNTYNYKYGFSIEIPKVCREDLVIISPKLSNILGGCSRLLVCHKVASVILLLDPIHMKMVEMSGQ